MRAVILAAGMGKRLGTAGNHLPKCLLEFGSKSLLQRNLEVLQGCGIEEVVIGTGYQAEHVEQELADISVGCNVEIQHNPNYEYGSVVTLWTLRNYITRGGDVVLMDADMLFDNRLLEQLLGSGYENCLLIDRNIEAGEEPVKLCIRDGVPAELRKKIDASERYDYVGEMIGMVRLSAEYAWQLVTHAQGYIEDALLAEEYEEVLRDLLLKDSGKFGFEDCTGLPWIEIDFPEDVRRARNEILPQLQSNPAEPGGTRNLA